MKCLELYLHSNRNIFWGKTFFVFLLLLIFNTSVFAKIEIVIKPFAEVKKQSVYIGDIADIKAAPEKRNFVDFIKNLEISKAPKTGKKIKIEKKRVSEVLKKNYIELNNVVLKGSDYAIVSRVSKNITPQNIKKDIERFIVKKYPNIKIVSISVPRKEFKISGEKISNKILTKSVTSTHLYLEYRIYADGILYKLVPVTVQVEKVVKKVVAKRDIPKGKVIDPADIESIEVISKGRRDTNLKVDDIVGKRAKRDIKRGSVIKTYHISPNYLVFKRKNVKIVYINGPIHIETVGLALENGSKGDIIRVKNISTNKVLLCKVTGPGKVEFSAYRP
ncbi:flagellar basal body P-ring formation chaperone FlgA [Nitrosophilus alvini]|uniref:flagellar basal body P-ring formation chaperone FlgA n=1 Tax=Nitrosophilus alvini TaxID=2714855 RepID=UPI00190D79F3|nr:flagellar basal body P-ring formation chaperone FlgA [Nitrosophilus alvini]